MTSSASHRAPARHSLRHVVDSPLGAAMLALVIVAATVAWTEGWRAATRPLWLDEVVTQLIANAPHGILAAMRSGADFQPPVHYALVAAADALVGSDASWASRLPSVVAAALTVLLLTYTLRRSLSLAASLAGAMALSAHPLFISQAVEGRPYALWILATALLAESLRDGRRAAPWLVAAASVAVCTSHYFGVLSLAAIGLAVLLHGAILRRHSAVAVVRSLLPFAAGALALAALLPLARAQLAATGGRSWVSAATNEEIVSFLLFPWGWRPAAALLVAGALLLAAHRVPSLARWLPPADPAHASIAERPGLALVFSALVPLFVVAITLTYKPVLVLRYAAPAVLAVATLCAVAVELFPRWARWGAVLLLLRAASFSWSSTAQGGLRETAELRDELRVVSDLASHGISTVSVFRHDAYRLSAAAHGMPGVAFITLSDSLLARVASPPMALATPEFLRVERDFGRAVQRAFAFPATRTAESLADTARVAVMRDSNMRATDARWLPGRVACDISPRLVVYFVPSAAAGCRALQDSVQAVPRR